MSPRAVGRQTATRIHANKAGRTADLAVGIAFHRVPYLSPISAFCFPLSALVPVGMRSTASHATLPPSALCFLISAFIGCTLVGYFLQISRLVMAVAEP